MMLTASDRRFAINANAIAVLLEAEVMVPTALECSAEVVHEPGKKPEKIQLPPILNKIEYGNLGQYNLEASPKTEFNLTTVVNSAKDKNAAIEKLMSLNGVDRPIAEKICDRIKEGKRLPISKKWLGKQNPDKRIVR